MNPTVIRTVFVAKASRKKLPRVRQTLNAINTAVNANTWPNFDADVEAHDVGHQPVLREIQFLKLRRQTKPVE